MLVVFVCVLDSPRTPGMQVITVHVLFMHGSMCMCDVLAFADACMLHGCQHAHVSCTYDACVYVCMCACVHVCMRARADISAKHSDVLITNTVRWSYGVGHVLNDLVRHVCVCVCVCACVQLWMYVRMLCAIPNKMGALGDACRACAISMSRIRLPPAGSHSSSSFYARMSSHMHSHRMLVLRITIGHVLVHDACVCPFICHTSHVTCHSVCSNSNRHMPVYSSSSDRLLMDVPHQL